MKNLLLVFTLLLCFAGFILACFITIDYVFTNTRYGKVTLSWLEISCAWVICCFFLAVFLVIGNSIANALRRL